ncbi:peptidylprolyl isomerase [Kangiella sp. HZ709]|nr:peptidylprolyl isomerase [Kangiella sp. HZ709]
MPLPKLLTLKTTQGDIVIRLFEDTPYTAANFIKLAQQGFYDKSYFHRVIPNFVAQGGGRFGDGSGSVGYSIREELNQRSHRYGTIGMATSGKDTGGGQFFINLAPNLHLDSNYTIFAEVIAGMEVALKLKQNDQVLVVEIN